MTISATKTVREVALELPQATRIFEKLRIDYCCGGERPLGEACTTAGVKIDSLVRMLEEAAQVEATARDSIDFSKASLAELITYILDKHHVYTKQEMERLPALVDKVVSAHGQNHPELLRMRELVRQLCADLEPHMFKEEQILFPYVLEMESSLVRNRPAPFAPFGTINNPIHMMMIEHDTVGDLLRELRAVSSDYTVPADACISFQTLYGALEAFEQDLHQHIHLENNILFPRAAEMEASRRA